VLFGPTETLGHTPSSNPFFGFSNFGNEIFFCTGRINSKDGVVKWEKKEKLANGDEPCISCSKKGVVVTIYEFYEESENSLRFCLGILKDGKIDWKEKHKYLTKGTKPKVSINGNNELVVIHEEDYKLFYSLAIIALDEEKRSLNIDWKAVKKEYHSGCFVGVSLNDKRQVMEVHNSGNTTSLWFNTGVADFVDGKIEWKMNGKYDSGLHPRVCLHSAGYILEIHKSENFDTLYFSVGMLEDFSLNVTWQKSKRLCSGSSPSVSLFRSSILEVHQEEEGSQKVFYSVGKVDLPVEFDELK